MLSEMSLNTSDQSTVGMLANVCLLLFAPTAMYQLRVCIGLAGLPAGRSSSHFMFHAADWLGPFSLHGKSLRSK